MKNILFVSILVLFSVLSAYSSSPETWQDNPNVMRTDSVVQNPNYDAALARKLGADDYGMKRYILVILRTGPSVTTEMSPPLSMLSLTASRSAGIVSKQNGVTILDED